MLGFDYTATLASSRLLGISALAGLFAILRSMSN